MPALATLALVWMGAEKPDTRAKAALDDWAVGHGSKLEPPRPEPGTDRGEAAQPLADQCDGWLNQARDQLNGGDEAAARHTLARLEQTLRDHPELWQSSWLMAERYRFEAQIAARTSPNDSVVWHARADMLEGNRAASFGERQSSSRPAPAKITVTLTVHGARKNQIYWNGDRAASQITTEPGEHHLLIARGSKVAWASWVSVLAPGEIEVWVPDAPPCSAEDLEGVTMTAEAAVTVPAAVRCNAWAAAAPGPKLGTVTVALCTADRCAQSTPLVYGSEPRPVPVESAKNGGLPPWATWTLGGVGVAAAASIILWRAGAFEPSRPGKVVWDGSNL